MREIVPIVLFFFFAFWLIFVMFKLFDQKYSIDYSAITKAAIGALVLGKMIPLVDWMQSGHRVATQRRAVVVAFKTFIYFLAVFVLAVGEKIFHGVRETGSLHGGINHVIANASLGRFLGITLLFTLVVGLYLVLQEISRAMGEGELFRLFFEVPRVPRTGVIRQEASKDDAGPA